MEQPGCMEFVDWLRQCGKTATWRIKSRLGGYIYICDECKQAMLNAIIDEPVPPKQPEKIEQV